MSNMSKQPRNDIELNSTRPYLSHIKFVITKIKFAMGLVCFGNGYMSVNTGQPRRDPTQLIAIPIITCSDLINFSFDDSNFNIDFYMEPRKDLSSQPRTSVIL